MPEFLHPGVFIQEIEKGPRPIEGVQTSTAAFIGETERGTTTPRLITSNNDYERWFGNVFGNTKFMPYAVHGFFENGGERLYVCRITNDAAAVAQAAFGAGFIVRAVGPGSWGSQVYAKIDDGSGQNPRPTNVTATEVFKLRLAYYSSPPVGNPLDWFNNATTPPFPTATETFDDLDMDEQSPNYWFKRVTDNSALAELVKIGEGQAPPAKQFAQLANGSDGGGSLDALDFEGKARLPHRAHPQGLAALELASYRDVALVCAPGASVSANKAVIAHCENLKFRFAVVDCDRAVDISNFQPRNAIQDTSHAALYYPWIIISDPMTGAHTEVPPGGHVLGVYTRSDAERGVFKAPANEVVRGVLGLTTDIDAATQNALNSRGVNFIRVFPGRGIRVWGARTLSSDPLWKYVSVRRLIIFLERSIYEGTQWGVFEPNDERLWARVMETIRLFLRAQWRHGALFGSKEEEAFFINCDRSTMTQDDILNGRLICEIGVAAARGAEFIIFRIFLDTLEAKT